MTFENVFDLSAASCLLCTIDIVNKKVIFNINSQLISNIVVIVNGVINPVSF